jgi:CRISPR/Cas system-associated exonuclease Cas4 (RecB family)
MKYSPLAKSTVVAFKQCPKRAWLEVHRASERPPPASLRRMLGGNAVGELARKLYGDAEGTLISRREGASVAQAQTEAALAQRRPIFEAQLTGNEVLAYIDILAPEGREGWRIVEVKSSTSVAERHILDAGLQVRAAKGLNLKSVAIAHIDNSFVYPGGDDYRGLLVEQDVTGKVRAKKAEVKALVKEAQAIIAGPEPGREMGPHCTDPYECAFTAYCTRLAPPSPKYPIDWLPRRGKTLNKFLAKEGIRDISEVPDEKLNDLQRRVKAATTSDELYFNAGAALEALAEYGPPFSYLDFETVQFAIPIWPGTRPYQQVPFQFSLHQTDEHSLVRHFSFLDLAGTLPERRFAEALVKQADGEGAVFVYNAQFERTRIRELADRHDDLRKPLKRIARRLVDLMPIARDHLYHPAQHGSWSIKSIVSALFPDLDYAVLAGVKDGQMAMDAYLEAIQPGIAPTRRAAIREELDLYCANDTLALMRLHAYFLRTADNAPT